MDPITLYFAGSAAVLAIANYLDNRNPKEADHAASDINNKDNNFMDNKPIDSIGCAKKSDDSIQWQKPSSSYPNSIESDSTIKSPFKLSNSINNKQLNSLKQSVRSSTPTLRPSRLSDRAVPALSLNSSDYRRKASLPHSVLLSKYTGNSSLSPATMRRRLVDQHQEQNFSAPDLLLSNETSNEYSAAADDKGVGEAGEQFSQYDEQHSAAFNNKIDTYHADKVPDALSSSSTQKEPSGGLFEFTYDELHAWLAANHLLHLYPTLSVLLSDVEDLFGLISAHKNDPDVLAKEFGLSVQDSAALIEAKNNDSAFNKSARAMKKKLLNAFFEPVNNKQHEE
jgi:hypothetical protein